MLLVVVKSLATVVHLKNTYNGKIVVYEAASAMRVRTGEKGVYAL